MSKAAWSGPLVTFGNRQNPAAGGSNNPDQGPNAFLGGSAFLDSRVGYNVNTKGWIGVGTDYRRVLAQVPATKSATNLAAAAHVVSGTPMVLAGASTGITLVAGGGVVVAGSYNTVPAGSLILDGLPALQTYGLADSNGNFNNKEYSVGSMLSRCITVTGAASGTGGNFLVSGYDIYGYPMTQLVAATAGATSVTSLKAFKFITSITPQFTDAHNYEWGTADVFGLPLAASFFHEVMIWWNSTLITASTGFVAADATNPATNATGDVRGTYAVQDASDGTKRLSVVVGPSQSKLGGSSIFGQAQV